MLGIWTVGHRQDFKNENFKRDVSKGKAKPRKSGLYECRSPAIRRGQTVSNGGGEGAEDPGATTNTFTGRTSVPDTRLPFDLSVGML